MKSHDKFIDTLKNHNEEMSKRYKALVSLKKSFKDQSEDEYIYPGVINKFSRHVFNIITEKMTRYIVPKFLAQYVQTPDINL